MRPRHFIITSTHLYNSVASVFESYLPWHDQGPKCTVRALLQVLFYAAAHLGSVFAACERLRDAPSDQGVRDALGAWCPEPVPLEQQLNRCFAMQLPKPLRQRRQRLAIDLTLIPYHGEPHRCVSEMYRSRAKSGTTHLHAYASGYLVHGGRRYTVGLIPVWNRGPRWSRWSSDSLRWPARGVSGRACCCWIGAVTASRLSVICQRRATLF